jgi:reactive intermediate/imine deaminase
MDVGESNPRADPAGNMRSRCETRHQKFPQVRSHHWSFMNKQIVSTLNAPAAIGIYSQTVKVGNTLWLSGQIPPDPQTNKLVERDAETQIRRVFENLKAVVTAAGATFDAVVKVNAYLTDLSHSALLNKVMAEYFREPYPARGAVGVAALAGGALVEVECIVAV